MPNVAPAVAKAVVDAYYPEALQEAENARSRAQSGYTIAGAVAAAIVAAGVFGDLAEEREWVQGLGIVALALWLLAALFYISAVAGRVDLPEGGVAADSNAFVTAALDRVKEERQKIDARLTRAFSATCVAVLVTVVALTGVLATAAPVTPMTGQLLLTNAGMATVAEVCGTPERKVAARMDPDSLGAGVSKVTLLSCTDKPEPVEVRLAKGGIAGFATDPQKP